MKNRLSKPLSILAILAPIVYLILAVLNYSTPMRKFTGWAIDTFVSEMLFYTFYIKGMEED